MAFPTGTPSAANVDQGTDSPAAARADLTTLINLVTQIIQSYAAANGICDLDATGKVPVARLPGGAGSGNDSDLLDGQHGAFYQNIANQIAGTLPAARFADSSHGSRGGGSLHSVVTQFVPGFASAADKTKIDTIAADISTAIAAISLSSAGGTTLVNDGSGGALAIKGIAVANSSDSGLAAGSWRLDLSTTASILTITLVQGTSGGI